MIEIQNYRLSRYDRVPAGEPTVTIRSVDPATKGNAIAYVHVPPDAPKGGRTARPPFHISGLQGEVLCSVRAVGEGAYDVHGGDGTVIGRITRRGGRVLPWPRRVQWTLQPATRAEPLTAKRGSAGGWVAWSLLGFPLYLVFWVVSAAQGLLLLLVGDKEEAKKESAWELEPPSRAVWHPSGGSGAVVDYRGGSVFHIESQRLDLRLAYAQAVLHMWDGI
ncbi:hypothetical protein EJ357_33795 [Streptomyces cyaneochromogenes]|uniref:Uncharacterized protein n=1 Tax=Streptomyces cyaneochromogenes TaxID=2496836 RepID=A0A3Q9ES40_9ACTN|nr:hypothetical protein [Streptomyces cyaneochromogenes]AZQ37821.1 hypothetical protein EJ357_33795 [Streptomyces cyaneochromogenes]